MFNTKITNENVDNIFSTVIRINNQKVEPIKLIVVDADNTLWGGVASEDSFENITFGSHSLGVNSLFLFSKTINSFKRKGFHLLQQFVVNRIYNHIKIINEYPECFINEDHFVSIKCTWEPKSEKIKEIVSELNLRLSSVLFIDDSNHEIDEVKSKACQMLKRFFYQRIFSLGLNKLETLYLQPGEFPTDESKNRTKSYKENKKRLIDKKYYLIMVIIMRC